MTKSKRLSLIFLSVWVVYSLLSAYITELSADEAYYWMYSRFLDWGYFDHPPMVALFNAVGFAIIPNELGVRLLSVLSISLSLFLIFEELIEKKNASLYWVICFSIFAFQLYGFTSFPDNPLFLFTVLFFILYKKYLLKDTWLNSILLSLVILGLIYSKYNSLLIILFTILSNFNLLKRKSFWAITVMVILGLLPHITWQFQNDFPSIQYHFFERSANPYEIKYTLEFFAQPFFYGPFAGFILIIAAFKNRINDSFNKALHFSLWGIFITCFLLTFKGRVEINWTLPALVPLLVLGNNYIFQNKILKKSVYYTAIPTVILFIFFKIHMVNPFFEVERGDRTAEFRGFKEFTEKVYSYAGDKRVVANKYQRAALLSFYGKNYVPALNLDTRKNQYSIWKLEQDIACEPVTFVSNTLEGDTTVPLETKGKYTIKNLQKLPILKNVNIRILSKAEDITEKSMVKFTLEVIDTTLSPCKSPAYYAYIGYEWVRDNECITCKGWVKYIKEKDLYQERKKEYSLNIETPKEKGHYDFYITYGFYPLGVDRTSPKKVVELP